MPAVRSLRDWDDLVGYCTYSAMPVGRFVLDVHGESRALWPANDALCAALQKNISGYRYWFHRQLDYRSLSKA